MVDNKLHRLGFKLPISAVRNSIYIPRYYNPDIVVSLQQLSERFDLVSVADLFKNKHIKIETGHEIGKMAYGTGTIPFIRTSDISNWEIKIDPKQGVSQEIYEQYADRQDVAANDIFFVRDGTYLIGQSCILTEYDLPCLYQSHIYKIRVAPTSPISHWLFFAALNTPIVKRQIRAKQFTADIIDTIGNRFLELILPIPKDKALRDSVAQEVQQIIEERVALRHRAKKVSLYTEDASTSELYYTLD